MTYIVPKPQIMENKTGEFIIRYNTEIIMDQSWKPEDMQSVQLLRSTVKEITGMILKINKANIKSECNRAAENAVVLCRTMEELPSEGYRLTISEHQIIISAQTSVALLYGIQSLRQLIMQEGAVLSCLYVEDFPKIANRGFYHDATRGRIEKLTSYKKLADQMSYLKLNQLQLYIEHTYLFKNFSEVWRDDTPLTAEEIMELDAYCRKLHIELVPSIATFGHLYKVLKTKSYEHLCELEGMTNDKFSFDERMQHHTLNISDERAFEFVKQMLDEFLPLFSSKYVNICADETFDLGKGKSAALAKKVGTGKMYVDFVKQLAEYCLTQNRIPMFWGDIIVGCPEYAEELPAEIICLNWGYGDREKEDNSKCLHELGMRQYLCPGVHGWRHAINRLDMAYKNVSLMCSYAYKYDAEGVLNTDWGDYGHFQDPDFSLPGMAYGAAFSWSGVQPEEETDRQLSRILYADDSETIVTCMKQLAAQEQVTWERFVQYKELNEKGMDKEQIGKLFEENWLADIAKANQEIDKQLEKLYGLCNKVNEEGKRLIRKLAVFAKGQQLIHETMQMTGLIRHSEDKSGIDREKRFEMAEKLEQWMYEYKEVWRESSKESELYRNEEVFYWYCDLLREC